MKHFRHCVLSGLLTLQMANAASWAAQDGRTDSALPDLPSPACDALAVPAGHHLLTRLYALGVQVYQWNGNAWVFLAPEAELFADPCHLAPVGLHYAGPTWEAKDGSWVVAARQAGCAPFPGAIPWLRLGATETSAGGRFGRVTHIQRVNTLGGTAPGTAGREIGEEARVPYTAEYLLYRAVGPWR